MCEKCKKVKTSVKVNSKAIYCTDSVLLCEKFAELMEKFYEYQKLESEVCNIELIPWSYDDILEYVFSNGIHIIEEDIDVLLKTKEYTKKFFEERK